MQRLLVAILSEKAWKAAISKIEAERKSGRQLYVFKSP
jgi:hypothetical protein